MGPAGTGKVRQQIKFIFKASPESRIILKVFVE
jgi:hypothetical protein